MESSLEKEAAVLTAIYKDRLSEDGIEGKLNVMEALDVLAITREQAREILGYEPGERTTDPKEEIY